jgi:hypothetical protein
LNPVSVRDAGEIERAVAALKFATPQSKQGRSTAWTISSHDLIPPPELNGGPAGADKNKAG